VEALGGFLEDPLAALALLGSTRWTIGRRHDRIGVDGGRRNRRSSAVGRVRHDDPQVLALAPVRHEPYRTSIRRDRSERLW
jgi:hypothetical protein